MAITHAYARMIGILGLVASISATPTSAQDSIGPEPIPISELQEKCGLDPDIMAGIDKYLVQSRPFVIFRNGYYCWRSSGPTALLQDTPVEVFSSTKMFGAILFGAVAARSSLRDTSRLSDWLTPAEIALYAPVLNPNATAAHVMAMTATSKDLSYGRKVAWSYDPTGVRELNILIPLMTRVIQREPARFDGAQNIQEYAAKIFRKLGMTRSTWSGASIGFSLLSTSSDLARLGQLVLRKGDWNGERIMEEQYAYRMTHASFEDSHTGLGYLTWLNAAANNPGISYDKECAPYVRWDRYPHAPFFQSPSSNNGFPYTALGQDIGLVWAQGSGNSAVAIHRGLDMVIGSSISVPSYVTLLSDPAGTNQNWIWDNIRPALVAALPQFQNDETGFCSAYQSGQWSQTRSPWSSTASL